MALDSQTTMSANEAMISGAPDAAIPSPIFPNSPEITHILSEQAPDAEIAAAEGALRQAESARNALDGELAKLPPHSEEAAALRSARDNLNAGIGKISSAIKNPTKGNIAYALGFAATVTNGAIAAGVVAEGQEAQSNGSVVMAQQASQANNWKNPDFAAATYHQLSAPAKTTYDMMSSLNIAGFNDKDANGVALTQEAKVHYAARVNAELDPHTKVQAQIASVIEQSPALKAMENAKTKEAETATQALLKTGDPALTKQVQESQKLSQQLDAPDMAAIKSAKNMENGQSAQQTAEEIKQATADRKKTVTKMVEDTFSSMGKTEQAFLREKYHLQEGQKPSTDQLLALRHQKIDHTNANNAAYVMAKHGEAGFAMLKPAEKEAYILTQTKMNLEVRRDALVTQEFYNALSPEEKQQFNEKYKEALAHDPKAAAALITLTAEEHHMNPKVATAMQRVTKGLTTETAGDFLSAAMTPDTADDVNARVKANNLALAHDLHLSDTARDQLVKTGQVWAKTPDFDISKYDFTSLKDATIGGTVKVSALEEMAGTTGTTANSGNKADIAVEAARPVAPSAPQLTPEQQRIHSEQIAAGTSQPEPQKRTDFAAMLKGVNLGFSSGIGNGGSPSAGAEIAPAPAIPAPAVVQASAPPEPVPHAFAGLVNGISTRRFEAMDMSMPAAANGNLALGHLSASPTITALNTGQSATFVR